MVVIVQSLWCPWWETRGKGRGGAEQEESQELVRIEREEEVPEEREEELGGLGVTRGEGGAPA